MTDVTDHQDEGSGDDRLHGWIDETGFEVVDTDDEIDEGAVGDA